MQQIKEYILSDSFYKNLYRKRKNDFIHEANIFKFIFKTWIENSPSEMARFTKWLNRGEIRLIP